jgi:hypothetical protein
MGAIRSRIAPVQPTPIDRSLTHAVSRGDLVRVGSEFDGGYVVPAEILANCDGILGLGVHADWSFEEQALARMAARRADLYDPTTTLPWLFRRAPWGIVRVLGGLLSGKAKRVADGRARLAAPWRYGRFFRDPVRHVRAFIGPEDRAGQVGIARAMAELRARGASRIVLKMDIEGAEYETLAGIARWGDAVDLLLVEFHGIHADPARFNATMRELSELFVPVHLHGNNSAPLTADGFPSMVEITFVARRVLPQPIEVAERAYPDARLDRANSLRGADLSFRA